VFLIHFEGYLTKLKIQFNKYNSVGWLLIFMLTVPSFLHAQEDDQQEEQLFKHHRVAIMLSHTQIPKGIPSVNGNVALVVPSWGLNYEYWFNEKWAIGMHNDMEISNYVIENRNDETLERKFPVILSLVGIYSPWRSLEFILGFGREFEENKKFWVYRFGLEYEFELNNYWDIAPSFVFDVKEDLYNSWTLGVVIGKRF
jgi:hypothetical protein